MSEKLGYRGYISSRPVREVSFPQRVQNLVVRDYASRYGLTYQLSATEYAMPGCYMMLFDVLESLPSMEGLIMFSLFMLPQRQTRRLEIYNRIIETGTQLHAALEEMVFKGEEDLESFEDMISTVLILPNTPMRGYYKKVEEEQSQDSFWENMQKFINQPT